LGPPLALAQLLKARKHSLCEQARAPRELPPGVIGADGHGVSWWAPEEPNPARYRHTLPIWSDHNVAEAFPHVRSHAIVASTRTATETMPVSLTNTPPFVHETFALVHNGSIEDFHHGVSDRVRDALSTTERRCIAGNTDTEYVAALLASDTSSDPLEARVRRVIARVRDLAGAASVQLNLIVTDGDALVATRVAYGTHAPSLYLAEQDGGTWLASEAFDDGGPWRALEPGHVVSAQRGEAARVSRLDP
jgi:gamma-glutamyl hercynylcysteine S-oxide hydrolase